VSSSDANPSIRERVLLQGSLTKVGVVVTCIVRAIKVTIPNLGISEYVDAELAFAPPHLPDGQFELHFDGRILKLKNTAGKWCFVKSAGYYPHCEDLQIERTGHSDILLDGSPA
jgi:hypothetical protein